MYYLIKSILGNKKCLEKRNEDSFTRDMSVDCDNDYNYPSNIQKVRTLRIQCNGTGDISSAEVWVDWHSAVRLNLIK